MTRVDASSYRASPKRESLEASSREKTHQQASAGCAPLDLKRTDVTSIYVRIDCMGAFRGNRKNPFEAVRAMMLENLEKVGGATQSYIDVVEKTMRGFPGANEEQIGAPEASASALTIRSIAASTRLRTPSCKLTYYERWIVAFSNILFEKGILTPDDVARKMGEVAARLGVRPAGHVQSG